MEFFKFRKSIPFMKHALLFNVISFVTFLLAVLFLWKNGLHLSIEFTGGAVMEVQYNKPVEPDQIRATLSEANVVGAEVLKFGSAQDVLIRLPRPQASDEDQNKAMQALNDKVMAALKAKDDSATLKRTEFVGSAVGKELAYDGSLALLAVCIGIVIYLAIRFEWRFAVATIIANLHDVIIILGFFAFFQWEFSLPVLAAVLAILGYSVNESVVVFDRARENFRKMRKATTGEIFDAAITGTISRTIITHGTTQMMVIAMLVFGGPTLYYFALALTIGICFGIYSSVLVACPIAKYLGVSREDFVKPQKKEGEPEVISAQP
ncbi:MAG: protein translocase subunit SecF [Burkholderiales bacterium]|jgi:preprotein translocase subunit SecF|nr:protein translocase subunit SecF [Nitrosomonadaceae bacterium]